MPSLLGIAGGRSLPAPLDGRSLPTLLDGRSLERGGTLRGGLAGLPISADGAGRASGTVCGVMGRDVDVDVHMDVAVLCLEKEGGLGAVPGGASS